MNREIKFRARDTQRKEYHHPALWDRSMPSNWAEFYILEQFTGLTDKNGVDIYEGDVWTSSHETKINIQTNKESKSPGFTKGVIEFIDGKFAAIITSQNNAFFGKLPSVQNIYVKNGIAEHVEVIGNIHTSPELITV